MRIVILLSLISLSSAFAPVKTCEDKPETGPCKAHFPKWYYDAKTEQCHKFVYGGCGGNGNRYATKQECLDHCGALEQNCHEEPDSGRCMARIPLYYYDAESGTCKKFVYGGCHGNGNRYTTKEECLRKCRAFEQNCHEEPDQGRCLAYIPSYYYDPVSLTCKKFVYGGCQGNGNRYRTKEECLRKCHDDVLWIGKRSISDVCNLPKKTGVCRQYTPRFFFDISIGECKRFIYSGCQGNANNFKSIEECQKMCG